MSFSILYFSKNLAVIADSNTVKVSRIKMNGDGNNDILYTGSKSKHMLRDCIWLQQDLLGVVGFGGNLHIHKIPQALENNMSEMKLKSWQNGWEFSNCDYYYYQQFVHVIPIYFVECSWWGNLKHWAWKIYQFYRIFFYSINAFNKKLKSMECVKYFCSHYDNF